MRFWRACVADPWSGGLIAVTVALFVTLHGLVGAYGLAAGASHQSIVDGFVICTLTGAKLAPADQKAPRPSDDGPMCCCCSALASPLGKVILAAALLGALLLLPLTGGPGFRPREPRRPPPLAWRSGAGGPRAPPLLSV